MLWVSFGVGSASFEAELYFAGIDDANYAAYNGASVFSDFNQVTTGHIVARLAANQTISVSARQESGATWKAGTGTFLEAVRLGDVNTDDRGFV